MDALGNIISPYMLEQNAQIHATKKWGTSGWKKAKDVVNFAAELKAQSILDYGCGRGTLKKMLKTVRYMMPISEFDPAIPKKSALPDVADLVVCTDVLEHVEPATLNNVMIHLYILSMKGVYLSIATRPANQLLPDGRNSHLIIETGEWWEDQLLRRFPWVVKRKEIEAGREAVFWLTK